MGLWCQCWCWNLAREKSILVDAVEHTLNCYSMQSIHFETQANMYMGGIKGPGISSKAIIKSMTETDAKLIMHKRLFHSNPCIKVDTLKANI